MCADLAVELQRQSGSVDRSAVTGQSGTRLADALRKAGGDAWAHEYAALHERRNGVVHGRWAPCLGDLLQVRSEARLAVLSEHELAVARSAAAGLTNSEIAERSFRSPATVKTLLARAMTKLDLSSCVQVAVLVERAGLTDG